MAKNKNMQNPEAEDLRREDADTVEKVSPEELAENWEMIIGVPPVEFPEMASLDMGRFMLNSADIQVWPVLLADGRMGVEAYSEELVSLGPNGAYTAFCTLLEQCIHRKQILRIIVTNHCKPGLNADD